MNKLAESLGIDPVEIRVRNLLRDGSLLSVDTPLPKGVSIDKVVEKAAERAGWKHTRRGWSRPKTPDDTQEAHIRRGVGFACGFKNVGFSFGAQEQCSAEIELHGVSEIDEVVLYHAGAEVGQGTHTAMAQMTAEAVGVPIEKVRLIVSDTAQTADSGSASASRLTFMSGNAIRGAAEEALEKWIPPTTDDTP
jgi:CO/xanthine dehydrogenase Mo-binding subunit